MSSADAVDIHDTVMTAIVRCRAAQRLWCARTLADRAAVLRGLRHSLQAAATPLTDILVEELGKLPSEAQLLDIAPAAMALSWAATEGPVLLADTERRTFLPSLVRRATSSWTPRGVCALISPWNYPFAIPMGTIAAALIGGNAVLWKPSEHAPRSARVLVDVLVAAGLPADLVTIVDGGEDAGQAVINADVDHVTFVGSTVVGRRVAGRCGERLIPCIVELGGKAPAIVLAGADLDRAANAIVFGGLANGGQSCVAIERVLVQDSVADALLAKLRARIEQTPRGRPVLTQNTARLRQAVIDVGGAAGDVVVDVTDHPRSVLLSEECFGAVIPCVRVSSAAEAITIANAHPLQLAASVFGTKAAARTTAEALSAPMVAIDDVMIHYALPHLPFGGRGASGYGRVHGDEGLRALCVEKVTIEPGLLRPASELWWRVGAEADSHKALSVIDRALALFERRR